MNTFKNLHPITLMCYFLSILTISMFSFNPVFVISGLFGAILYLLMINNKASIKTFVGYLFLFIIIAITNPLFSHNGATPLFFINDSRITLEALLYGVFLSTMIIEVMLWFRCFNLTFDNEKLMYFFGKTFPKLGLIISMALHYIPNLISEYKSILSVQKTFGGKKGIGVYIKSFSAVITQSLENSIEKSNSMSARGYGKVKRTYYSNFKFTKYDLLYLVITVVLFIMSATSIILNTAYFNFYPTIEMNSITMTSALSYIAFLLLSLLPFVFQVKEEIKWKYLVSKI
ncbi:MAG: energy-coupling factor transporter transmembrane component T [Oscillospiraceae bacterium]|nr:energy-coupling factor transporter transmembrane component T [Oscillospiraceae bacterium]